MELRVGIEPPPLFVTEDGSGRKKLVGKKDSKEATNPLRRKAGKILVEPGGHT